jgi:peptidoglycan/LPS O-acetylase OafA/YrhL
MTLGDEFARPHCFTGSTWLRLFLALGIFTFHSVTISYGSAAAIPPPLAALARLILPMFFALSGFLIAASLSRSDSLIRFIVFRAVRLLPALIVVVLASMLILGPLLTSEGAKAYFTSGELAPYLGNIAGRPHYSLPGVFLHNPRPGVVNGSLWTIPAEVWCYFGLVPFYLVGFLYRPAMLLITTATSFLLLTAGFYFRAEWAGALPTGELVLPFLAGVAVFAAADWLPSHPLLAGSAFIGALLLSADASWSVVVSLPLAYATVWLGMRSLPPSPGDYSYGLYLVGYPVQQAFVACFVGHPWYDTWLSCLPLSLGIAALLWHFVEKPLLDRKTRFASSVRSVAQLLRLNAPKVA